MAVPSPGADDAPAVAARIADAVRRADVHLPGLRKCLPRAIAVQWLLRVRCVPSRLVVAVHRRDRTGEDAFHAWVEVGGSIVIGQCDRADYSPVITFVQPDGAVPAGAA